MTNAEKIALNIDGLADLIYRSDDISADICRAEFDDNDEPINCKHKDDDKDCMDCIKEWLMKEVDMK